MTKVALIGYGVENQAAYRYFADKGVSITVCDQNPSVELPEGMQGQLGENYLENLDSFDLIVRTSGMHPSVILAKNPEIEAKITTAINIFFEECKTPIIGVTGTKGKGTTSTLISKILEAAGKKVVLAGNIGIPALDMLSQAQTADYVVLELSSFQLYDVKHSPRIAVCLMVVPEHLNWHSNYEDYKQAKTNLFRYQKSDDVAIFNALNDDSREISSVSPAHNRRPYAVPASGANLASAMSYVENDRIYYKTTEIASAHEVALLGRHNLENICAAIAATWNQVGGNVEAIRSVITSFTGLPFRLELIRELNGVKYYNDSFSTTPETAIAALRAFEAPKIVILGGSDKGVPFDELAREVAESNVKHVLAIGDVGSIIANLLQKNNFTNITTENLNTMEEIILRASELAEPGDVVLLSTGAASFGMFTDYKDRGTQFNQAVQALS